MYCATHSALREDGTFFVPRRVSLKWVDNPQADLLTGAVLQDTWEVLPAHGKAGFDFPTRSGELCERDNALLHSSWVERRLYPMKRVPEQGRSKFSFQEWVKHLIPVIVHTMVAGSRTIRIVAGFAQL